MDISRWAKIPTIFVVGEMSKSSKKPELSIPGFWIEAASRTLDPDFFAQRQVVQHRGEPDGGNNPIPIPENTPP